MSLVGRQGTTYHGAERGRRTPAAPTKGDRVSRSYPVISADSHITDGGEGVGDLFAIDGMNFPVPMGLVAAAGKPPEEIKITGVRFEDLHRGGWDPEARLGEQDQDGVQAEVIYPTVGMVLCNHPDFDYKRACFAAYNRWMAAYCETHPQRLLGCGQTAMRTPEEGIEDLKTIKSLGLRGVMMPGNPAVEDYDSPVYDAFWEAAIELELPLSFHILTTKSDRTRGPALSGFLSVVRGCQDIMAMLVLGGVFERHPDLKVVCVEADAGWVPHFMYRMDHAFNRHRYWLKPGADLTRLPSEYFAENIYVTFQDDWTAFRFADAMNWRLLMWANDFPHSDSTWPWSQELLEKHATQLSDEQQRAILCENVAELYKIDTSVLTPA
jgi:predicted TIM-barrel fold metal-dependent hydrolase